MKKKIKNFQFTIFYENGNDFSTLIKKLYKNEKRIINTITDVKENINTEKIKITKNMIDKKNIFDFNKYKILK